MFITELCLIYSTATNNLLNWKKNCYLELSGIEGGAHDDKFEVGPVMDDGLEHAHQDVGGKGTLVSLVEQDDLQKKVNKIIVLYFSKKGA